VTADTGTTPTSTALREQVLDAMRTVLPHVLQGAQCEVTENARIMEDLGLTSTNTLELMLELEEVLDILVDVEDIAADDVQSLGTLADYIAAHSQPAG
jgi:acyl carrier protein